MSRLPTVPTELARGPFSLADASAAGLSDRRLRGAAWRRVAPRTYVVAALAENPHVLLRAALKRLPPEAAFSGLTSAWLADLDVPPCDPIEVTLPESAGVSLRVGIRISRARLDPGEVVIRHGLRCTAMLRTLADLGRRLPLIESVVVADMALHRGLLRRDDLAAYLAALPASRGVRKLRLLADLTEPRAESPMETRLRLLLVLAGLPKPLAQISLHDARGRFLGRPDLYYPQAQLAIEYDGGTHRDTMAADNRRQNRLVNGGHRLLRFTFGDLRDRPDGVIAEVRAALGRADRSAK